MHIENILLEYERERARQVLGDGLWKAALRDDLQLWSERLENLQNGYPGVKGEFIDDTFKDPRMQRERADRALHRIEQADPSTNKKYTQWMARQFATGQVAKMEDVVSTLADYVARFNDLVTRKKLPVERRDINRYKKYQELFDTVDWYEDQQPEEDLKGKARKAYEDSDVTVIVPEDEAAACKYGRKTRWCTAATKGQNYFEQYNRQGPLYIIIPKQTHRENEKYQLHFESGQFMDENDDPVQLSEIITNQFPGLYKFFMSNPTTAGYIQDMTEFATDDVLQKISDDIWNLSRDRMMDVLSDWEINDDYYYEWLRKEGYMDEDGNLNDNAPSYLEFNDEARRWEIDMEDWLHPGPDEIRTMAKEYTRDGTYDEDTIYNIEGYISQNIKEQTHRARDMGDGGLATWIDKNIVIKRTEDGPRVELVKRERERHGL